MIGACFIMEQAGIIQSHVTGVHMFIRQLEEKDLSTLAKLYISCFAEPPWYEVFTNYEATEILSCFLADNAIGVVVENTTGIVGFTGGVPARERDDLLEIVGQEWNDAFYHAEIFVDATRREVGVASLLMNAFWQRALERGFVRALGRTSVDQPIIRHLYSAVPVIQHQSVTSMKMISGVLCETPDERVIFGGSIKNLLNRKA